MFGRAFHNWIAHRVLIAPLWARVWVARQLHKDPAVITVLNTEAAESAATALDPYAAKVIDKLPQDLTKPPLGL